MKSNADPDHAGLRLEKMLSNSPLRYVNPFLFFRLRNYIKRNNITHLIIEHPYFGWLGWLLKKFCGIRLAIHSHNIEGLRFKSTGKWWWGILWNYEKWVHRRADINFFITDKDLAYAARCFKLQPEKCHLITYGTELTQIPTAEEKINARKIIAEAHGIKADEKILLFNGILSYKPNLEAIDTILKEINPMLFLKKDFKYKIIICGKDLPASYNNLADYTGRNIIYPGFVPDIRPYFIGSDVFINPVTDGGGIKTKLVEALGYNLSAVSTETGATGIPLPVAGNKLSVISDSDINGFCDALYTINTGINTPKVFFNHFYWGNIAGEAGGILMGKLS